MKEAKGNGAGVLLVLLICLAAFLGGFDLAKSRYKEPEQRVDTLIVEKWDTLRVEKPTEIVRYVLRYDTIKTNDTIKIAILSDSTALIPIERAIYKDSTQNAKYEAFLSGFRPKLDSIYIECLQTEKIITIEKRQRRLGLGVQAGYGVAKDGFSPYFGVGVQYRIW